MIPASYKKMSLIKGGFIVIFTGLSIAWRSGYTVAPITKIEMSVTRPDPAKRYDSTIVDAKLFERLEHALLAEKTFCKTFGTNKDMDMYIKLKVYREKMSYVYGYHFPDVGWVYCTDGENWYKSDAVSSFFKDLGAHVPRP